MAFKKFIAIHTYHSEETKKKFWSGFSDKVIRPKISGVQK